MKQLLESLIKEWWSRPLPEIFPREVNLVTYLNLPVKKVVSVVGFRRSGKTYSLLSLAQKVGPEKTVYINFEDERIPKDVKILTGLINVLTELSGQKSYILLMDEIQNIPRWESWARRVVETTSHKLFVTGSSSKLASSELPTQLRGRSLTVEIKPLNLREFMVFKKADPKFLPKPQLLHFTREYLLYGGFPEIVLVDEGKKAMVLDEYYKTFLTRDIIERHNIRNKETLKALIKLLLNSSFYTLTKLTNSLKSLGLDAGKATISRYLSFLEESFFLKSMQLHTPSIKNRLKAQKKPYFVDNFLISRYSTAFSQNLGRLMENLVANNLDNIFYWKDYRDHEVDFVVREKEVVDELIQTSYVSDMNEMPDREIKNLVKAAQQLKSEKLSVITWDLDGEVKKDQLKIKLVPLHTYLLEHV